MKILITGTYGQLAREFLRLLPKKGVEILSFPEEELDITDFGKVREKISTYKPEFVINCAAYNFVDKAEKDAEKAFLVNGMGVRYLLLSCMDTGAVLVHFSTDYVFDGRRKEPYTIADIPHPLSKYGMSKLLGERVILHGGYPKYYLIRTSCILGDGKNSFVVKLLRWMKENWQVKVVKDQISSPTYTGDLAKAVFDLLQTECFGTYHITNTGYCSRYEWATFVAECMGWDGEILPVLSEEFSPLAQRPEFSPLNNFPLKETIGYVLPDWKDATQRFLKKGKDHV